jgi:uncharacterized membrane protein
MVTEEGKTRAIVAHITIIGWIVAVVMNNTNRDEFASFYIRQLLGLAILGIIGSAIPYVQYAAGILVLIFWIISLVGAINNEKAETPIVGPLFQDWFKAL